jgi:group I intron endonuclease
MVLKSLCGIYKIENLYNQKAYIGRSVNISYRIWEHKNDLKKGKDLCSYLQNAWNKYGETCFVFDILEECSPEILNEREVF